MDAIDIYFLVIFHTYHHNYILKIDAEKNLNYKIEQKRIDQSSKLNKGLAIAKTIKQVFIYSTVN